MFSNAHLDRGVAGRLAVLIALAVASLLGPPHSRGLSEESAPSAAPAGSGSVKDSGLLVPEHTLVVVLPFLNELGREDPEGEEACEFAHDFVCEAFAARAFGLSDPKASARCLEQLGINLKDADQRNRRNFQRIAEHLDADLVLCGVVRQHASLLMYGARGKTGIAEVQVKLYERRSGVYRANAVTRSTDASDDWITGGLGLEGRAKRFSALRAALASSLESFLKPYPVKAGRGTRER